MYGYCVSPDGETPNAWQCSYFWLFTTELQMYSNKYSFQTKYADEQSRQRWLDYLLSFIKV